MNAIICYVTDTETRRHGDQTGLETLVVHAVNNECSMSIFLDILVNALNIPPGQYDRKIETQRN